MSENGKTDVLATRAKRAAASTGATVRRTGRGIRAKAYGKIVELHERLHAEAEETDVPGAAGAAAQGAGIGPIADAGDPVGPADPGADSSG